MKLKKLDPNFEQFGSGKHQYKLNSVISEKDVLEAEKSINLSCQKRIFGLSLM